VAAGVMPKFRLQQRRPDFTAYACKHTGPKALYNLLTGLGLYIDEKHILEEHVLRQHYIILRQMFRQGTGSVHAMKHTSDSSNAKEYEHFSTSNVDLKRARKLYVVVLYHGDSNDYNSNPLTLYASGRSNQSPTASKRNHEWKAKAGEILTLNVGGAYGGRKFHFGVRCHLKSGCSFELLTLTSESASAFLEDDICGDGTKKVELHKDAGPFKVDLVVPWVTSERFVMYATGRMNDLHYNAAAQREVLRQLMRHSDKLDVERFARVSQTQVRLQQAVHKSKKWVLTTEDGSKEASWLQALTGVNQGGVSGKKRMNHATEFPLVGAFEFAAKFTDIDGDGTADLIISGDFGTSQMYWGHGNKTFKKGFFDLVEDGFDNSMGATVGDWDMDGQLDVLFTSTSISDSDLKTLNSVASTAGLLLSFRGNHLYRYVGDRRFEDVTTFTGVRESGWGWGAFFFDFDNDGDLDALNGNGMDDPETTDDDWAVHQNMRLYVNQGKDEGFRFIEEAKSRNIASTAENRAALAWDFDNDGDLDVFVVNHADVPQLYQNEGGNYYDWIRIKVVESNGKTESIGAKVWLHLVDSNHDESNFVNDEIQEEGGHLVYYREIGSSSAFLGQAESIAHFGLGKLDVDVVYKIDVRWPGDSTNTTLFNVPIRNTIVIKRNLDKTSYVLKNAMEDIVTCYDQVDYINKEIEMEPNYGEIDMKGSVLSEHEIRYRSVMKSDDNFEAAVKNDFFKLQYTLSNGTKYHLNVNVETLKGQNDHTTLENKINDDKEVAKDRTASSKLEKVNIVQRLQRRYRQAAMFFEQRMESVDSIIEIANSKGLSREKFLQLIEKKYPMAIA
jgi:hypothetical protein